VECRACEPLIRLLVVSSCPRVSDARALSAESTMELQFGKALTKSALARRGGMVEGGSRDFSLLRGKTPFLDSYTSYRHPLHPVLTISRSRR